MNDNQPYKTLYKLNTNGSTQVWSIYHDDKSYWTVTGKVNGKMIVGVPTIVEPKQKRTLLEQVVFICESKINKQKDKKYVEDINDIQQADDDLVGFSPMLAHKYNEHKSKIIFPCACQPKLDGIRNLSMDCRFFSRGRKEFTSCEHIKRELESFFHEQPEARLDGEFYTHEYKEDFEQICKAVKKTADKATDKDLEAQKKVEYWVYDAPRIADFDDNDKFINRQSELAKTFADYEYVKVVPTIIANNEEELLALKEKWIEEGYEGIMVRNLNSPYEGKRSYNLLKWKDFIDEEFIILRVNEGSGKLAGHAGSFTFGMVGEKSFDAKMIGSIERLKYLFENQDECIGKLATVRFQNYTADGIPRFPVCRGIRNYE